MADIDYTSKNDQLTWAHTFVADDANKAQKVKLGRTIEFLVVEPKGTSGLWAYSATNDEDMANAGHTISSGDVISIRCSREDGAAGAPFVWLQPSEAGVWAMSAVPKVETG